MEPKRELKKRTSISGSMDTRSSDIVKEVGNTAWPSHGDAAVVFTQMWGELWVAPGVFRMCAETLGQEETTRTVNGWGRAGCETRGWREWTAWQQVEWRPLWCPEVNDESTLKRRVPYCIGCCCRVRTETSRLIYQTEITAVDNKICCLGVVTVESLTGEHAMQLHTKPRSSVVRCSGWREGSLF